MAVYIDQQRLMDALTAEEITHVDLATPSGRASATLTASCIAATCMA
jgi:hypothetical protein